MDPRIPKNESVPVFDPYINKKKTSVKARPISAIINKKEKEIDNIYNEKTY
jgi:hypothetical protein